MITARTAAPKLKPEQMVEISGRVAQYIADQRECYRSRAIPLEVQAYALESRFARSSRETFAVHDEVRQWIEAGRY